MSTEDKDSKEESPRTRGQSFMQFWQTLPGVLTAVAALVTAFSGLLIALNHPDGNNHHDADGASSGIGSSSASSSGTGGPPSPFVSMQMYDMARDLFDPHECARVTSPSQAPLAWDLDPQPDQMVRCTAQDETFTAVFMCNETGDLNYIRTAYLDRAIEGTKMPVTDPPAGKDKPVDGVQIAYQHVDSQESRVYWDSPAQRCAAELQSRTESVDATVSFWANGPS